MTVRCIGAAVLVLVLLSHCASATITLLDTGRRYRSVQDHDIGKQLWRGYEYMARLQYLEADMPLCRQVNASAPYQVTIPNDGLPVALLVRGGGCSLQDKIYCALNRLEPKGLVKYLIIDDTERFVTLPSIIPTQQEVRSAIMEGDVMKEPGLVYDDDLMQRVRQKEITRVNNDEEIPLYIIQITSRTEFDLLDYLLQQSPEVVKEGGPRITIDSRLSTGFLDGEGAIWIALSALLSACACSFLLMATGNQQGWWQPEEETHAPPVRQARRRLTKEQVKRMLPIYRYDGTALRALEEPPQVESENGLISASAPPPEPVELSLCSICLDDYEPGDKLRCLPCNHAFHAKCVGKWLAERSATCPLCKDELYADEEDEEESDDGEPVRAAPAASEFDLSWWDRLIAGAREESNMTQLSQLMLVEHADGIEEAPRQPWWRRVFTRRRTLEPQSVEATALTMLTEPLLSGNDVEAPLEHDAGALSAAEIVAGEDAEEGGSISPEHMRASI